MAFFMYKSMHILYIKVFLLSLLPVLSGIFFFGRASLYMDHIHSHLPEFSVSMECFELKSWLVMLKDVSVSWISMKRTIYSQTVIHAHHFF